jgi:hypothetical protein
LSDGKNTKRPPPLLPSRSWLSAPHASLSLSLVILKAIFSCDNACLQVGKFYEMIGIDAMVGVNVLGINWKSPGEVTCALQPVLL